MLKPPDQDHDIGDKIIRAFSQSIKLNPNTIKLKEEHLDSHMSLNLTPEESEKRDIMLKLPDQDLDAKRESDVLEIELQKQLLKKEREKEVNDLEIEIIKSREENQADVDTQDRDIGDKIIRAFSQPIKSNPHTKKLKHLDSRMSLNLTPEQSEKRVIMLGFCVSLILLGACSILTSMGIYQRLQKEEQKFTIHKKHTKSKTYRISSYSFRKNYSFFNLEIVPNSNISIFTNSEVLNKSVTFFILFLDFFLPTWPY